jgi:nitroimidazol reductase NimA-like FMN-containing flavoprotein (pyridoxamine 5'-phosphate oxidase superfamily)
MPSRPTLDRRHSSATLARTILDANLYMTLGTADDAGRPWVSPVYYAADGYTEFFWISSPEAQHSRNIATRPQVGIVVFDSHARVGSAQAVYLAGVARELTEGELDRGIEVYSRRSVAHGARAWKSQEVRAPAPHRLYRATVSEHSILDATAQPVHGRAGDRRTPVNV